MGQDKSYTPEWKSGRPAKAGVYETRVLNLPDQIYYARWWQGQWLSDRTTPDEAAQQIHPSMMTEREWRGEPMQVKAVPSERTDRLTAYNPTPALEVEMPSSYLASDKQQFDKEELVQRLLEVASLKRELSEAHAVLDKAEISRKRSMDGGQTWPEYSLAERVNIVCGALTMPDEDFSATRESVLEEAAKVCEQMRPINPPTRAVQMQRETLDNAARLIRALKQIQYVGEKS